MKFLIITPSYGREEYIEETIRSVVYQQGDFDIEYIIQEGSNNRKIHSLLKKWEEKVNSSIFKKLCNSVSMSVYIETDSGMYNALNKGFQKSTGDVLTWINTDDIYHPGAFQAVVSFFQQYPEYEWIIGNANSITKLNFSGGIDCKTKSYSQEFIKKGYYRIENLRSNFNWIPQDCSFWTESLWKRIGSQLDENFKYSADFYLWLAFAEKAQPVYLKTLLGAYRSHGDQITANPQLYIDELPEYRKPSWKIRLFIKVAKINSIGNFLFQTKYGLFLLSFFNIPISYFIGKSAHWSYPDNAWKAYKQRII